MTDIDEVDEDTFNLFVQSRYQPQLTECKRKEAGNALWYQILQWLTIILSALTAILVGLQSPFSSDATLTLYLKIGAIVSSIIITLIATALKTFNYQARWTHYHNRIVGLEAEMDLFTAGAAHYTNLTRSEKRSLFIHNVSKIIIESERGISATYGGTVTG